MSIDVTNMYNWISALQKEIRRGHEEAACYWAIKLMRSGFENVMLNRLRVIVHEDIGTGDLVAGTYAMACLDWCEKNKERGKGYGLSLMNAVLSLSRASKSRDADDMLSITYFEQWKENKGLQPPREIPDYAYDRHTREGKARGRKWEYFFDESSKLGPVDKSTPGYHERAREAHMTEQTKKISIWDEPKKKEKDAGLESWQ